jgi:DNA replication and repair protein RecF
MITDIRLQRFRSYKDESFEFDPGVNIVVGANASGKTNLLEAVLVVCRGNSFRAKDQELLAFGAPWARLDAHTPDGNRSVKLVRHEEQTSKEYEINSQKLKRLLLNKQIPTILFEPNHLLLLNGSPERRRDYLDNLLEQVVPGYGRLLRDYRRALAQRNALLKHNTGSTGQLFAWNIRLSELGGKIATHRLGLIERINKKLDKTYQALAGSRKVKVLLGYETACQTGDYASSLLKGLESRQDIDMERGFTTIGPHRDDLLISFNKHLASEVASRGETRTTLLALKITELDLVEESRGKKPMLLLDDVFSELDGARRRALTEIIKGYQTFITTTDADVVVQHFMDRCHIIPLGSAD